jgi:hypothetical protein
MTGSHQTRREFLRTTAAVSATAAFGAMIGRAAAQGGAAQSRAQIDAVRRTTKASSTKARSACAISLRGRR